MALVRTSVRKRSLTSSTAYGTGSARFFGGCHCDCLRLWFLAALKISRRSMSPGTLSAKAHFSRPLLPPTGFSRIAVALASSSVVHAARGASPLTVKLVAGHGAGRERKPRPGYLDVAQARGTGSGTAGAWRDPCGPGPGRTPARDHPANLDAGRRLGRGTSRRGQPVRYRQPGCRRARLLGMSLLCLLSR